MGSPGPRAPTYQVNNLLLVSSVNDWFSERLKTVPCTPDTRAYIVGVMSGFRHVDRAAQLDSIVLAYAAARQKHQFEPYQSIGDWALWLSVFVPSESNTVSQTLGQLSYLACHRIVRGQWKIYEELADDFECITAASRRAVQPH